MRVLLDTHTMLWFWLGDTRISPTALQLIQDPANTKLISPASYWETAIKISLGKYSLQQPFDVFFQHGLARTGFQVLPIEVRHASVLTSLPFHHRDPFDRLLIAQSMAEGIAMVSNDPALDSYPVKRLW